MDNFENFKKIPQEKQTAVINAGYACFGRSGYKKTAMSEIAAVAGVSKAALFHYFGAKEALYQYLFHTACDTIAQSVGEGSEDFYDCMRQGLRLKLRVFERHPSIYEFLLLAVKDMSAQTASALAATYAGGAAQAAQNYISKVDWGSLRIAPEQAQNIVRWLSEGVSRDFAGSKTADEIGAEYEMYLQLLKPAIYKEEYL